MDHIQTFFAQGIMCSRAQASKYTDSIVKVTSVDGAVLTSHMPSAPKILHNIINYPEIPEINYDLGYNPVSIIMKTVAQMRFLTWDNDFHVDKVHHINLSTLNVAGKIDVTHHLTHLKEAIKNKNPDIKLVVFGCSRGAAVTLISISLLTPEEQNEISLVIVEAPFDTVESVLRKRSYVPWITLKMLEKVGSYSPTQMSPLDAIKNYPLSIPTAFITSKIDNVVPTACTQVLIDALEARGHPHMYHLVLDSSPHALMSLNNVEDTDRYKIFVDDLYHIYCQSDSEPDSGLDTAVIKELAGNDLNYVRELYKKGSQFII